MASSSLRMTTGRVTSSIFDIAVRREAWFSWFPFPPIVLCVRQDMTDVDDVPAVLDDRDQPVLVSTDVEHRERIRGIAVRKFCADIG